MKDHTKQLVKGTEWLLTPQAWSGDTPIGYQLTLPNSLEDPEWVQYVDGDDTVTLTWWEEPRLYYRSIALKE